MIQECNDQNPPCIVRQILGPLSSSLAPPAAPHLASPQARAIDALDLYRSAAEVIPGSYDQRGAAIRSIATDSWAEEAGFEPRDVARAVDNRKIRNNRECIEAL